MISRTTNAACLVLLMIIAQMFNCEPTAAQSLVVSVPLQTQASGSAGNKAQAIPNSITKQQLRSEAMLAQPIAQFGITNDTTVKAAQFFETLEFKFFYDPNIEGIFDRDTELEITAGVSLYRSLSHALQLNDVSMTVETDGTISLISVDDEYEPEYLATVIYDITNLVDSKQATQQLAFSVTEIVDTDSWEENGGGSGVINLFEVKGSTLMSINNSYQSHLKVRSFLRSVQNLGIAQPVGASRVPSN